jgi:hypothetical protein
LKKKFDRSKINKGARKAQDHSNRTKGSKGVTGVYSFDFEETGLPVYKPISDPDKPNKVAFLPYWPGDKDPIQGKKKEDDRLPTYILDFWDHNLQGVGRYICLLNTYGKPCPVCEYIKANRLETKDWLAVKPTRRGVYAVWDLTDKSVGPKIWYTPFKVIEEKVQKAARDLETGEIIYYTDIDDGSNLFFTFEDKGDYKYEYDNFQLKQRKDPLPDDILEAVPTLDNFLVIPTYDEVRLAFDPHGSAAIEEELNSMEDEEEDSEEDEEEERPRKPNKLKPKLKKVDTCPEGGDFGADFDEYEECGDCKFYDECGKKFEELKDDDDEDEKVEFEPDEDDEEKEEPKVVVKKPLRRRS